MYWLKCCGNHCLTEPAAHYTNNTKGNMFPSLNLSCSTVQCGGGPGETKAVKKKKEYACDGPPCINKGHIKPQSTFISVCVTFMSFTMAWNNPPSAPHSFSTESMVSKKQQQKEKKEKERKLVERQKSDRSLYRKGRTCSKIRHEDLCCVHPPFVVLSCEITSSSGDDVKPLSSPQQPVCEDWSAQTKRNVLPDGTDTGCAPAAAAARSAAASRLCWWIGRRDGAAGDALGWTTAGKRGGHMHSRSSRWSR